MHLWRRMLLKIHVHLFLCLAVSLAVNLPVLAQDKATAAEWPAVLVIDDFESGDLQWTNDDAGKLEVVTSDDAPSGKKYLRWTAADDGIGKIIFKSLDKKQIDFSQYDLMRFYIKPSGKPLWNLNPIIQQYPHAYGYRALYYSVDTLEGMDAWIPYVQDLSRWENAWPDTFDAQKQEFMFEVHQMAGAGHTVIELDRIELVKNTLDVPPMVRGDWRRLSTGAQQTIFEIPITNTAAAAQTVRVSPLTGELVEHDLSASISASSMPQVTIKDGTGSVIPAIKRGDGDAGLRMWSMKDAGLERFAAHLIKPPTMELAPGESGTFRVVVNALTDDVPAYYGETLKVVVSSEQTPGLDIVVELPVGTRPEKLRHPIVLCTPEKQAELRQLWKEKGGTKEYPRWFRALVDSADKSLSLEATYPPLGHPGISQCPVDGARLVEIDVPNLKTATVNVRRHQCPKCGRAYSGMFYDAAADNWYGTHMKNGQAIRDLGIAYGLTGERKYAEKSAEILLGYVDKYLDMPIAAPQAGSPVFSQTSGATRIGASFMHGRRWLTAVAIGLDFIREADVISDEQLRALTEKVFAPCANNMMDHKVGVMNLQFMIASAGMHAGLAADDPQLVARAVYDPHGINNLMRWGYLADGNWWENPSYQNVANGIAFPILTTMLNAGITELQPKHLDRFRVAFKMYGPDGRSPTLGTGGPGGFGYSRNVIHSLADRIDDPELAWVAHNQKPWFAWNGGTNFYDSTLWMIFNRAAPKIPAEKAKPITPNGTIDFPEYGGIAMRVPDTDMYCYLAYGRHLVHGHFNKMSINAYGKGGWFVRNVMGGYGTDFKEWLEPVSGSSTIMVDGKNQDADTGELLFKESAVGVELASAREVGAYKDVEHERSLMLTKDVLVVIDRCLSDTEHTYDWLYHTTKLTGPLADPQGLGDLKPLESLGDSVHLKHALPAQAASVGAAPVVTYTRKKGGGAAIAFTGFDADGAQLIRTENKGRHEGLIARKQGKTVAYACVMQPFGKDDTASPKIERLDVVDAKTGKAIGLERGQAYRVTANENVWVVVVNYGNAPIKTAGEPAVTSDGRVTAKLVSSAE